MVKTHISIPASDTWDDEDEEHMDPFEMSLSARQLLTMKPPPQLTGWLQKKHEPWCSLCGVCKPTWKKRFVILKGDYLFRFASPTSKAAKGVPIAIQTSTIKALTHQGSQGGELFPRTFQISTITKEYLFAAETTDERDDWVRRLLRAKGMVIKQSLGHAPVASSDKSANKTGSYLVQRRARSARDTLAMNEMAMFGGAM